MRALFVCDGAQAPPELVSDASVAMRSLNTRSTAPDLNLRVENLWDAVLDQVDGRAADLVRIAACVYAADQEISRGGRTDVYGDSWNRDLHLAIPVSDLAFWADAGVREWLQATLNYLTSDTWTFWFSPLDDSPSKLIVPMGLGDRLLLGNPDCVILFSGGADSLCAAVELMTKEQVRPLLVSHRPSSIQDSRQRRLAELLRERAPKQRPAHIGFWIHRAGSDAADYSQRSRGFLFASLGAALAGQLGISRVELPDNGVISVNLPINAQVVGTMASRSTHPKFIWHFNRLIASMFEADVRVENTLGLRTRAETLGILREAGWEDLLRETVSCSHPRGRTKEQRHCGDCSQCVDRRFGTIAAGFEVHDPSVGYQRDIFTDELPDGDPRTIPESYVRLARTVRAQEPEQLYVIFPQLDDVIAPDGLDVPAVAAAYADMFRRHGETVVRVLGEMIGRHRDALAANELPDTCLLRLATGGRTRPAVERTEEASRVLPPNLFRLDGRMRHIHYDGYETWVDDTVGTRQLARLLGEPGREIDVMDLVERRADARRRPVAKEDREVLAAGDLGQDVLDAEAIASYRARLRELSADREAAERDEDQIEIARIDREREQIEEALDAATGLGGRPRSFMRDREKARQSVRRAITLAREAISSVHPSLGRHLENAVSTGSACVYRPETPIVWVI